MDINYNITSLIDILGLVQGIFLGLILLLDSKKVKPKLFLGLFLMTYSFELLNAILRDLNIFDLKPWLLFLPFNFYYLTIPLFYIYVKRISNISFTRKKILFILLPGIIEFIFYGGLFLLKTDVKLEIATSQSFSTVLFMIMVFSFPYSLYYSILTIRFINNQKKNIDDYYSNTEGKLLIWAKGVAIFLVSFLFVIVITLFLSGETYSNYIYPTISSINVIFIFLVGISGLRQASLFETKDLIIDEKIEKTNDNTTHTLSPYEGYYEKLTGLMINEKLFLEPNLSLADVASKLNIPQRRLSELIRNESNKNFNQFVNSYRVEKAKKLLLDSSNDHLNMLGIAFDSGFSSKATFYSVFKKFTSQTPNSFKNKILTED
ncbi:helix-turn-helix domain-containing protein [uncultured Tenacibaculum sp.]|uniref:helix-turn-helix domain-containing protein n=1 Tax=uncultured Tenacibaculum sp. TaxID=174713 RepID=UPI00261EBBDC|nr:helix-turn-helix domain-containing protein [uncultured Tenacibaculum sp.]